MNTQAVALREKNSLFFNDFKMFIIQILYIIYLLDYLGDIIEKNTHHRCKTVVLWTISKIKLFLGLRLYIFCIFYYLNIMINTKSNS